MVFEFYNNCLQAVYKKKKYMKYNKNDQLIDTMRQCETIL